MLPWPCTHPSGHTCLPPRMHPLPRGQNSWHPLLKKITFPVKNSLSRSLWLSWSALWGYIHTEQRQKRCHFQRDSPDIKFAIYIKQRQISKKIFAFPQCKLTSVQDAFSRRDLYLRFVHTWGQINIDKENGFRPILCVSVCVSIDAMLNFDGNVKCACFVMTLDWAMNEYENFPLIFTRFDTNNT